MHARAALAAACLLAASAPALGAGPAGAAADIPGMEALSSSAEARGDYGAMLASLANVVEAQPGSLAARLALLRIAEVRDEVADAAAALRAPLEKALEAGPGDVEIRDRIESLLFDIYAKAGDFEKAAAALHGRGVVRDWLLVGPFGFSRRALHDRPFGPEIVQGATHMDVNEAFDGSAGKVRWRKVTLGPLEADLDPSDHLHPVRGAAYALAQVRGPADARALVTVRSSGSFKVFWNGTLAADFDRSEAYLADEVSFPVTLGEGWNRLLLKDTSARASFSVRIVAADGSGPIRGLEVAAAERIEPLGAALPPEAALRPGNVAVPEGAWGLAALAEYLEAHGLTAEALPLFEKAAKIEPRSPHILGLWAAALEGARHLPETQRKNDARRLYEQALARDPKFFPALVKRAAYLEDDGKPEEAVKALDALSKDFPAAGGLYRAAARMCRRQGWDAEYLARVRALEKLWPKAATPKVYLAEYYEKRDPRRALALYREALAADRSLYGVEDRIASLLMKAGDLGEAEKIRRGLVARFPADEARVRALAEVTRAKGDLVETARLFEQAAEIGGGDPDDLARAGDALWENDDAKGALDLYRRALALEPGNFGLRRMAARAGGEDADFWKPYDLDGAQAIAAAPPPGKYPKASSLCLLDHTVTRLYRDGSQVDFVHQIFKIADAQGVERYHTLSLPGEILLVRTYATDGRIYEPIIAEGTSEILMPKLEPGAVIEYRYRRVQSHPPAFQFDSGTFFFKDPNFAEPLLLSRYDVIVDKGLDYVRIQRNFPESPETEDLGDRVRFRWEKRDSDRIDPEPLMPAKEEILPLVELVQRRTWDDVHEILREQTLGRTRLTPELRAKAAELTAGEKSEAAAARKIYDFVLDHVKNEQGGGAEASEILASGAGQRLVLLKALLDAAGIPARFAICGENPALAAAQVWDPPRPDLLSGGEALVVEPRGGGAIWVVPGGKYLPYGKVPLSIQGAPALLLGKAGGEFRVVPSAPAEDEGMETRVSIALDGRAASVDWRMTIRESGAYHFKERIATAPKAQLRNMVEAQAGQLFLGARVVAFDFPDVEKPGAPFALASKIQVPAFVEDRDGSPSVKTGISPLSLTQSFGGKPTREQPMMLRMMRTQHDSSEIALGAGWEVASVPPNVLFEDKFGAYSLTFEVEKGKVRVTRSFAIFPSRVEPAEYPGFLKFLREVDAAEAKRIHLRKAGG
jgi:tetratricopeptide (TPR) repeat protein